MSKTIFYTRSSDFEIIEATKEAQDKYGHNYGSETLIITQEHIKALKNGKCLASDDGEYSTFIIFEKTKFEILKYSKI